jgi:hypothetical protein
MYCCIYASGNLPILMDCAAQFSPLIETHSDMVVFDARGLERLHGPPESLADAVNRAVGMPPASPSPPIPMRLFTPRGE